MWIKLRSEMIFLLPGYTSLVGMPSRDSMISSILRVHPARSLDYLQAGHHGRHHHHLHRLRLLHVGDVRQGAQAWGGDGAEGQLGMPSIPPGHQCLPPQHVGVCQFRQLQSLQSRPSRTLLYHRYHPHPYQSPHLEHQQDGCRLLHLQQGHQQHHLK